jgi:hypothetical protein
MPQRLSTGWGDEKAVIQSFLNRQVLNRNFFYPPMQWRHQVRGATKGVALLRAWRYLQRQEISRATYLCLNIAAGAARRATGAPWPAAWLIHPYRSNP